MIITVGTCVECYTQYATQVHDDGSSDVTFLFPDMNDAATHLNDMHAAGTPHSITPTLVYQDDQ